MVNLLIGICFLNATRFNNIQQYVLEGIIIAENIKYRWNPYNSLLSLINKQDEFRKQAENNLNKEVEFFINRT